MGWLQRCRALHRAHSKQGLDWLRLLAARQSWPHVLHGMPVRKQKLEQL